MQSDSVLSCTIDSLMQQAYPPTEPGVAVIVARDSEIIFRKAYGMAHLELGMPLEPDMVFRLASITKQFTAVAILMLMEQGKLALDDPLTKFLPNYPTHDHLITIEHLLTHTSGIRSYTEMPEWPSLWRKDFTSQELIAFFQHQPMQFAPGKRWAYNNSAYVLLGTIIEKISGQCYEQFIQQNIFDPSGMKHSYHDNPLSIIPRRVPGYDRRAMELVPTSPTEFFVKRLPLFRIYFVQDADYSVTALESDRRYGPIQVATKVTNTAPSVT